MAPENPGDRDGHDVTQLLNEAAGGSDTAVNNLLPLVYASLRSLAADFFLEERRGHTLQPTALVHEAYLRLVHREDMAWESRGQFFVIAAKAMRNILVDHARGRDRLKRGGGWGRFTLDGVATAEGDAAAGTLDLVALDEALERLSRLDERKARLVELRFFAGIPSDDAARLLGISRSTAAEDWRMARAWLLRELTGGE